MFYYVHFASRVFESISYDLSTKMKRECSSIIDHITVRKKDAINATSSYFHIGEKRAETFCPDISPEVSIISPRKITMQGEIAIEFIAVATCIQ